MNISTTPADVLPGSVCIQWKRCGKSGCRCASGQLHGPYYRRFWRESGRLRSMYVKQAEVEQIRAACEERRARVVAFRAVTREARQSLRRLERMLKIPCFRQAVVRALRR